ncbi:class I SAM-dependent methyltransferase [Sulfobacillus harzensis]|uniref:Class I SAM-dependent methyltransferase n=1 Tax=Sulfobacillus harzensis TaxID=2729629 RepID=A0A7Y0L6K1_9FIRM|nr:class I SAM-dependent methyltransferase [Sulfobacillus harzensis]NMP23968.1 class I SAM-dependent methyltransferase [Sulfobacillus harzensis]
MAGGASQQRVLEAGPEVHDITGPGVATFQAPGDYAWFDGGDPLGFDPRASLYHKLLASHNQGVGEALVERLPLKPGELWVDIGTGTGAMVAALQNHARSNNGPIWIFGIDRAGRMMDEAWESASNRGIPAWFIQRDLIDLSWPRGMVDGVTALLLFHLVDDLDAILRRAFQALKPGGRLLYAVSADSNPFVQMIMHQLEGPGDFFKRGQQKIRHHVVQAGFVIEQERTHQDIITVDNPEAMRDLISSIGGPATRGIRRDIVPPSTIPRVFQLVWAQKPSEEAS